MCTIKFHYYYLASILVVIVLGVVLTCLGQDFVIDLNLDVLFISYCADIWHNGIIYYHLFHINTYIQQINKKINLENTLQKRIIGQIVLMIHQGDMLIIVKILYSSLRYHHVLFFCFNSYFHELILLWLVFWYAYII